jgi:hypothetical protein
MRYATALFAVLLAGCGVRFTPMALEDPYAGLRPKADFPDFRARTVYANTTGDEVWGPDACGELSFDNERAWEGTAIRIQWNKGAECPWTGMGIGWNGWEPKDLSGLQDEAAFRFRLRSAEGESRIPVMILILEDYGGVMSAAPLRAGHMERYPLNEEWREVTIPLSEFPARQDRIDLSNIKQLVIELQGAGDVLIDDFRVVALEEDAPQRQLYGGPSLVPLAARPVPLFEGSLPNAWGLEAKESRDFRLDGGTIVLDWQEQGPWSPMGFSWTRWLAVDLTEALEGAAVVLDADLETEQGTVLAGFQDYNRNTALVDLRDYRLPEGGYRVPLRAFPFAETGTDPANVKGFYLDVQGSGRGAIRSVRVIDTPDG